MARNVLFLLVLALAGCGSHMGHLPQSDQDAMHSCIEIIREEICDNKKRCSRNLVRRYGQVPTTEGRQSYLIDLGCPEALVMSHH